MKLYGFTPSPNTWMVRAVAAHLGIALDMEYEFGTGQNALQRLLNTPFEAGSRAR